MFQKNDRWEVKICQKRSLLPSSMQKQRLYEIKGNQWPEYSTREFREKLYDDLHVRLRDTMILMTIVYCLYRSKYEFNSCHYWSHADFPSYDTGVDWGLVCIFDTCLIKQSLGVLFTQKYWTVCFVSRLYISGFLHLSYASSELIAVSNHLGCSHYITRGGIANCRGSEKKGLNNIVPEVASTTALVPPYLLWRRTKNERTRFVP